MKFLPQIRLGVGNYDGRQVGVLLVLWEIAIEGVQFADLVFIVVRIVVVVVMMTIMMIVMIIMPIMILIFATRRACHQRRRAKPAFIHLVWLRPPAVRFPIPRADSSGLFHLQWLWNIVLGVCRRAPGPLAGLGPVR